MTNRDQTLLFAHKLDGEGASNPLTWAQVDCWTPDQGPIWIHLNRSLKSTEEWLRFQSGLSQSTVDALLMEESRPRVFKGKLGTVSILHGVNLNPGHDEEDMVDLRIWSEGLRVITLQKNQVYSTIEVLNALHLEKDGPGTISELYESLIFKLCQQMSPTFEALKTHVDALESTIDYNDLNSVQETRQAVNQLRSKTAALRRYIAPQRIAISELLNAPPKWVNESWHSKMREIADMMIYYLEELDSTREQVLVIKDDISSQISENTNRTLYALAVISGIFLPLSFLTGLLGINVGGIPGVEKQNAFWIFSGLLLVVAILEIILFKKLKWL